VPGCTSSNVKVTTSGCDNCMGTVSPTVANSPFCGRNVVAKAVDQVRHVSDVEAQDEPRVTSLLVLWKLSPIGRLRAVDVNEE